MLHVEHFRLFRPTCISYKLIYFGQVAVGRRLKRVKCAAGFCALSQPFAWENIRGALSILKIPLD
jgi:hypothetical protein